MLFLIGIPHGALDGYGHANGMRLPKFILRYSGIMAIVLLFWAASPIVGLLAFILYSAWHFGETDMREWGLPSAILSMVWGTILFALLLLPHMSDVNLVLSTMGISEVTISEGALVTAYRAAAAAGVIGGLWFASVPWLISIATLLLLGEQSWPLPLEPILSFSTAPRVGIISKSYINGRTFKCSCAHCLSLLVQWLCFC